MKSPPLERVHNCGYYCTLLFTISLLLISCEVAGQYPDTLPTAAKLKSLSLEELMDIEVTSVSKRPEKLAEVASAIQVITSEDIRRSGATNIPEALRLSTNLQVAKVNASQWAISARGFNNVLANKLLVLIDGRTVYTALYAGVFWDVQNLVLEDVDRIEVISGPGGTLWGANAVNGVINIITKNSSETKGLFIEAVTGSSLPALGSLRYGGSIGKKISYRIYGTGFKIGNTAFVDSTDAKDEWTMLQGGFRADWDASSKDKVVLQSNIYGGKPNPDAAEKAVVARGSNILARWNHTVSSRADFQLQVYYDHTWRDFKNGFTEDLKTYDIDWQNRYLAGKRNEITYGFDLRLMEHKVTNLELFAFLPEHKTLYLYSLFLQDKIMLLKDRLYLTVGCKVEHNSYTGFEFQPNGRINLVPAKNQTVWAAVSRAVRTPVRTDREFFLYLAPGLPFISGNDDFRSEEVIAYELGWRLQPLKNLSASLAAFYNVYDNIRSAEPGPPPFGIPITFGNGVKGKTYGFELSATYQPVSWWNLRGGYTFLKKELSVKPGSQDTNEGSAESNDPDHQATIQSSFNLPGRVVLGAVLRYVDKLPDPKISAYKELDLRIGWKLNKIVEINIVGQNLLNSRHIEFIPSSPSPREIKRSIYGKIICRL